MRLIDFEPARSIPCMETTLERLRPATSPTARSILKALAQKVLTGAGLARQLGTTPQRLAYHLRMLKESGIIRGDEEGYRVPDALAVPLASWQPLGTPPREEHPFITPFIEEGRARFTLVVGSPDAHGPHMARSKDASFASDLMLWLGSYLAEPPGPVLRFDTEVREEALHEHLIVIGGPIVNLVAESVNWHLPVRFEGKRIVGPGKHYAKDETGLIVRTANPYRPEKKLLFLAGVRQQGTRAAVLATIGGTLHGDGAHVVQGLDEDGDGIIDRARFL